ncbi:unnamed protein product, partial [Durusdinium trenchii]
DQAAGTPGLEHYAALIAEAWAEWQVHWVAVVGKGWPSGTDDLGVASSGRLRLRRG